MESSLLKVYALILNYNSADDSIYLFKNLKEKQSEYLTVLVIDNNSIEIDSCKLRENIPPENLIFNKKNLGYAAGNNVGIALALKANANYVWILNPDVRVEKDSLSLLIETFENDSTLAAVGPRIIQRENLEKIFSDGEKIEMDEKTVTSHKNHNLEVARAAKGIDYEIDYIAGSSILLNCEAIREIGKLPEEYFLYFEETDWCFNAQKYNWKLAINSNSVVYNLTSIKSSIFYFYFMRNKLIFCKKYHPNYRKVRNYYFQDLIKEIVFRTKGKYLKPYFYSRLKGVISGIIKNSLKS
jgi:hypothetical protein